MYCWLPVLIRPLSPRHREIAQLRADGLTQREIAERLRVSQTYIGQATASIKRRLRLLPEHERVAQIWPGGADQNAPAGLK